MQNIKSIIQLSNLSTTSGIAAKMEPISTKTNPATSSHSVELEKLRKRVDQLFLRFAAIYGHMWKSLYKSDDFLAYTKQEWMSSLEKFDSAVLDKALLHCKEKESYPPSLPLFVEICKACVRRQDKVDKQETPKCDPAIARMHLDQLREMLNMKPR